MPRKGNICKSWPLPGSLDFQRDEPPKRPMPWRALPRRHSPANYRANCLARPVRELQSGTPTLMSHPEIEGPPMLLAELNWPRVAALSKDTPVIIPVAALEQHGHHMPVFTDSMLLGEVVRRAHERLGDKVLVAPLMWLGNSHHHMDFAGTMSATPRTYLDLLCDMMENMIFHGFKRIVIINGHGGNDVPGKQAVFEVRQRHRQRNDLCLLFATYWLLGGKPHEVDPSMTQIGWVTPANGKLR